MQYFLNRLNNKSTTENIKEILEILPNDPIIIEQTIKQIAKITKHSKPTIEKINKIVSNELKNKIIPVVEISNDYEIDLYGELITEPIVYDYFMIEIREKGIYKVSENKTEGKLIKKRELILYGNLQILKKTTNNIGIDLFRFRFNKKDYVSYPISFILKIIEDQIYKGNMGKDIVKHTFNVIGDTIKKSIPEYVLGWNNGWKIPQLEDDKNFMLVCNTDFQIETYERVKKIINNYSKEAKEGIQNNMKEFLYYMKII